MGESWLRGVGKAVWESNKVASHDRVSVGKRDPLYISVNHSDRSMLDKGKVLIKQSVRQLIKDKISERKQKKR